MTVRLEGPIHRYIGLSTDEKPVPGLQYGGGTITDADLPSGSSFLESDTWLIYRWNGSDTWTLPALEPDPQLAALQEILVALTKISEIIEFRAEVGS